MSTRKYVLPVEQTAWHVPTGNDVVFTWNYDEHRDRLLGLYERGKAMQWNANERLDWSHAVDPDNPSGMADEYSILYGSDIWARMDAKARAEVKHHIVAWQISQFLHGEQGALVCTARIVESVPDLDSKYYAATQVMDEARHVEVFSRFLREKLSVAYPINPQLKTLLNQILADGRWDMIYLGMQVMIEGLALAAFQVQRDMSTDPLLKALNAYVMQDEARHVAFGRLALRDYYPQLTEKERDEREQFVVEASYLMRDRFLGEEVWDLLGHGAKECVAFVKASPMMRDFRRMLFSRIVPTIKDIGLWGPRVKQAFADMDVMVFESLDPDVLSAADEQAARAFDDQRNAAQAKTTAGAAVAKAAT